MAQTERTHWRCRAFGHSFRPRYSTEPVAVTESMPNGGFGGPIEYANVHTKRTYVHDVCTCCGLVANRLEWSNGA